MSRLFVYLGRFALILIGYAAACLAASATFILLLIGGIIPPSPDAQEIARASLLFIIPFTALFIANYAFVPAIGGVFIGELISARSWLYYAIVGAVSALAIYGFSSQGANLLTGASDPATETLGTTSSQPTSVAMLMLAAGLVGGIVYWIIAGRSAGSWREKITWPERSES